ncbi:MAG: inorganic phosphate transporter [Lewinellaceae bacterium]|nr:inorganic phosphate transporter [Lewinellaceae bacterium]
MEAYYLAIVGILFLLAISDLIVGVSNDAVNFLNSAVGAKAASFRTILVVAALGIIFGCTFSSGMMEVARKGIFHPEHFYFSEIMLLFLAVMVTDVILLDSFNTLGMPTSTTVSIVFELLGAAVALSVIKVYTDPNALSIGEYINSGKALAIISGILVSVIIAFSVGLIIQYFTRLLFSFNYEKRLKYFGSLWGGLAIAGITYFILVKGAKGASFITEEMQAAIDSNVFAIIAGSFVGWVVILQLLTWFTKVNIFKLIVLVGTFALAMAFASNDLVNFIGVPLAGFNSYEILQQNGDHGADGFLMTGLAGKVPTPTILLLLSGLVMTITLWTSRKARTVIKTSVDLGRQYDGAERFDSYAVSRSLVRSFSKMAKFVNDRLPAGINKFVVKQFDEKPFTEKQANLGAEAPAFDMVRAAVTLVVASSLIAFGTALKLPLSTTYVTFMVFMGTSLADGAWGRESAVYRVSGVLSVIGGWFFTAFSAFTLSFIIAGIFYFGGPIAIGLTLIVAGIFLYRSHRYHGQKEEEDAEFEKAVVEGVLTRAQVLGMSISHLSHVLGGVNTVIAETLEGLDKEDLKQLTAANKRLRKLRKQTTQLKLNANKALDKIEDDELEAGHLYILVVEYLWEIVQHATNIVRPSLDHVDNHHKPLLSAQIKELKSISKQLDTYIDKTIKVFEKLDSEKAGKLDEAINPVIELIREVRKKQIKRIKNHEIGTRNSLLYLNHLGEFRNLALFSNRLVKVYQDLIIMPEEAATKSADGNSEKPKAKAKK